MTTGNTFSAFSSQNPSIQSMLISATPTGIKELADCGKSRPTFHLPLDVLDKIVEGKANTKELEEEFSYGYYMHEILPSLVWWINVSQALSLRRFDGPSHIQPVFDKHKDKLIKVLNDALSQYALALAETNEYRGVHPEGAPASIELIKRYRLYTRAVCAVAQKVWPAVDLDWLLKQP